MAIITTTNLSALEFGNRIDGELYNPNLLLSLCELKQTGYELKPIGSFCVVKSGTTPTDRDDSLKDGPILFKTTDIRNNVLSPYNDYYHINTVIHNRMQKTKLKGNDVLLNIVGATLDVIGRSAIIKDDIKEANITQAMAFLRIIKDNFKSGFLFAYLNTKYAQDQIKRYARPTGQFNLNLVEVKKILVPNIVKDLQTEIDELVNQSGLLQSKSHTLYQQAEELLAQELQLDKLQLPKNKWYTAQYSEVVDDGRMDSEYYQPKYRAIMNHISSFHHRRLDDICDFTKGFEVGTNSYTNEGNLFMRVSNISKNGVQIGSSDKHISSTTYQKLKSFQIEKGDVLCTKDGTIAMCYVIDEDVDGIFSSGIVRLTMRDNFPKEYLAIVINSIVGNMQAHRVCSGALITHWKIDDMKKMLIPIIDDEKMIEIADLVSRSKEAKQKSKQLLARAKTRVEELIEQEANKK